MQLAQHLPVHLHTQQCWSTNPTFQEMTCAHHLGCGRHVPTSAKQFQPGKNSHHRAQTKGWPTLTLSITAPPPAVGQQKRPRDEWIQWTQGVNIKPQPRDHSDWNLKHQGASAQQL